MIFILGKAVYRNWEGSQKIAALQKEIDQISAKNKNLENLILYYQTRSFKEIEARRKLGLKLQDEKVISVPISEEEQQEEELGAREPKLEEIVPNHTKWWQFFFQ